MATAAAEIDMKEVLAFVVGPVAVLCWHDRPTIASLKATQDFFIAHYQGRDMVMLSIVEETSQPPEPAERSHVLANMHRFGPGLRAGANLIEGEGFKVAAIRAVMTGITFALRLPFPMRIFASLDECAPWLLASASGHSTSPAQLTQAIERRRQMWRMSQGR